MKTAISLPLEKLTGFCRRRKIVRLEVFGSVLRDDFTSESDVDFLVTFAPDAHPSLFGLIDAEAELSALIGRKADLVERPGVEASENWIRKKQILGSTHVIFHAA